MNYFVFLRISGGCPADAASLAFAASNERAFSANAATFCVGFDSLASAACNKRAIASLTFLADASKASESAALIYDF